MPKKKPKEVVELEQKVSQLEADKLTLEESNKRLAAANSKLEQAMAAKQQTKTPLGYAVDLRGDDGRAIDEINAS